MIKTNPESLRAYSAEKPPERFEDKSVDGVRLETNEKINAIVRTNSAENDSDGKNNKKHDPNNGKGKPPSGGSDQNVRFLNGEHKKDDDESPNFGRNATLGVTTAATLMASLSPAVIAQIPLIGKIPYLPQAAASMQAGIQSIISPLGLGTGANATNAFMAMFPTWCGPAGATAVAVPAALWSIGMIKSLITRNKYGGLRGNISEGSKTLVRAAFVPYHALMGVRNKIGDMVQGTWDGITKPIRGAWNHSKKLATAGWNTTVHSVGAATKPTWLGAGGAFAGTALGLATGGAALIPAALAGYAIPNYLQNSGALKGSGGASPAHAGH